MKTETRLTPGFFYAQFPAIPATRAGYNDSKRQPVQYADYMPLARRITKARCVPGSQYLISTLKESELPDAEPLRQPCQA